MTTSRSDVLLGRVWLPENTYQLLVKKHLLVCLRFVSLVVQCHNWFVRLLGNHHSFGDLAHPGTPEAERRQVEKRRHAVEHAEGLRERLQPWIVGLFRVVGPDLADLVPRSKPFLHGVPLVHDPGGGLFEVKKAQEGAGQDDR